MMRPLILLLAASLPSLAALPSFRVEGTDPAPWTKIFEAVNIPQASDASVIVLGPGSHADAQALAANHIVILEGTGFASKPGNLSIRQIRDTHAPDTQIIWEQAASVAPADIPADYTAFASERWQRAPVLAGKRGAHGAILWLATAPGTSGYERYPYLLQALADLGMEFPIRGTDTWAFFDSAYRIRADVDYLAKRWRQAGISVLQVAAWHNLENDPAQDQYLKTLIEACHRNAILVYAWLELPHVSDKFWADHPEWREKTALGQDAQLDWRKLMNLQNPDCHREAARQISALMQRFDWDGANMAELYFESLEGSSNPARFTPMNDNIRSEFQQIAGFDPKLLFDAGSPYSRDSKALRQFLDYRAVAAARMQSDWLKELDQIRLTKPYLSLVLTHLDDRFDPGIRDQLGADVKRALPLMQTYRATLLIEDPATLWNLGPERYAKLAGKYRELKPEAPVSVDINVVERYQDVYPTKKQTGVELLQLMHQASASFSTVALYVENSIAKQDLALLPAAASAGSVLPQGPDEIEIEARQSLRVAWEGAAELDGKPWPLQDAHSVLIPAGRHRLAAGVSLPVAAISDFNGGQLRSALSDSKRVDLSYSANGRAIALLGSQISSVELDGQSFPGATDVGRALLLPSGQHVLSLIR